jgi:hypothetical protein
VLPPAPYSSLLYALGLTAAVALIAPLIYGRRLSRPLDHRFGPLVVLMLGSTTLTLAVFMLVAANRAPNAAPKPGRITLLLSHGPDQPFAIGDHLALTSGCSKAEGTVIASPVGRWLHRRNDPVEIRLSLVMPSVKVLAVGATRTLAGAGKHIAV